VDAEEDIQDFRFLFPCLDPAHGVMLFLRSERAFHRCDFVVYTLDIVQVETNQRA